MFAAAGTPEATLHHMAAWATQNLTVCSRSMEELLALSSTIMARVGASLGSRLLAELCPVCGAANLGPPADASLASASARSALCGSRAEEAATGVCCGLPASRCSATLEPLSEAARWECLICARQFRETSGCPGAGGLTPGCLCCGVALSSAASALR